MVVKRIEVARNIFRAAKSIKSDLEGSSKGDVQLTKRHYVCTTTATTVTTAATTTTNTFTFTLENSGLFSVKLN